MTTAETGSEDLLHHPLWRPEDLGRPLPHSVHAVSVCLPRWADVVGYEEADPQVLARLQAGYPRFFVNPLTTRLFEACRHRFARGDELCHVYPSLAAAERSLGSIQLWSGQQGRVDAWTDGGPFVVTFPKSADEAARKHWRHSGDGISSRCAAALYEGRSPPDPTAAKQLVRRRIAQWTRAEADDVYLFGSGMSAVYAVHRVVTRLWPNRPTVQFGFPYVDTLKIQQDMGPGAHFLPHGDVAELQRLLDTEPVCAIFCEFPSNPLLSSPNLGALAGLARQRRIPLIVDETLGTYVNTDVMDVADVALTSLTKYVVGAGDVMAGAAIVNPRSLLADRLRQAMDAAYEDALWADDAVLLAQYSADFPARVARINRTAEQVCDFCRAHPAVTDVYYPKFRTPENYRAFQRPDGGYGGLFSLLLKNSRRTAAPFYDALRLCKGPNLGCNFSLCCPFTLLAHYQELDFVERCGVDRDLIRISIGLEEPDDLIDRLDDALRIALRHA